MASRASLNHTYRTVWNPSLGAMVAVAEISRSHVGAGLGGSVCGVEVALPGVVARLGALALGLALGLGGFISDAVANPTGAAAIAGQASLASQGNKLTVTTQNGLGLSHSAINWQSFSIPAGSSTHFQQPNAASTSINRVVSNTPSQIFGALSSNGRLVLVNQSGITVGAGAVVDTAGFTASSLRMSDADALAGRLRFGDATVSGAAVNVQGSILARTADAVLIASNIEVGRDALIQAPNGGTLLAAGQQIELTGPGLEGIRLQVQAPTDRAVNLGMLKGDAVGIFAGTLRHSGQIRADAVTVEGGRVVLKAASQLAVDGQASAMVLGQKGGSIHATAPDVRIESSARLDASGPAGGGEVLVGGGYQGRDPRLSNAFSSQIDSDAELRADATAQGHGGIVVVWADDTASVHGNLSARGGPLGGDGGFIETSGKRLLAVSRAADASAPAGRAGTWLLDPFDITIDIGGTGTLVNGNPQTFTSATPSSTISASTINTALNAGTSVTISTGDGAGSSQPGNITVLGAIEKTSGIDASLTLNAHNNIDILANVSGVGTGGKLHLVLNPDSDANGSGASTVGDYLLTTNFVNVQNLTSTGALQVLSGGLTVQGTASVAGQLSVQGGTATLNGASTLTSLEIAGGTFAGTGNVAVSGSFSQTGGTLGGSGTLTLNGSANTWSGGSWTGGGTTVLAPGSTLAIGNPYSYYQSTSMDGRTLHVRSGATANIQGELGANSGSNTIDVNAGGTLQFSSTNSGYAGSVTSPGIAAYGSGAVTLANTGSIVVQPGTNAYIDSYVDPESYPGALFAVNSTGAVTVNGGGSLNLYSSYGPPAMSASLTGALAVGTGATLSNSGTTLNITPPDSANLDVAMGSLVSNGGMTTLNLANAGNSTLGALAINGGTVTLAGGASTALLNQTGGSLAGTGTLTLNEGAHNWSGGSWGGGGVTQLAPNATLTVGGLYSYPSLEGRTLNIGSGALADVQGELAVNSGVNQINVNTGGTLRFSQSTGGYGGSVFVGIASYNDGALSINNAGAMQAQSGTSAYLESYVSPVSHPGVLFTVNSAGAVTVGDGGSLDLYSSYGPQAMSASLTGALAIGTGAALSNNGAALNISPASVTTPGYSFSGILAAYNGDTTLTVPSGNTANIGAINISGGTLAVVGEAATQAFSQTAGNLSGNGLLTLNSGNHTWASGTWKGDGTTVLAPGASLAISDTYFYAQMKGRTLQIGNGATANVRNALHSSSGSNSIDIQSGGLLKFSSAGYGGSVVSTISALSSSALTIVNSGTVQVDPGISAAFESYGDPVSSPTSLFTMSSTGAVTVGAGGALEFYSSYGPQAMSASLTGSLNVGTGATLSNNGAGLSISLPSAPAPGNVFSGTLAAEGGVTGLTVSSGASASVGAIQITDGALTLIGESATESFNQSGGVLSGNGKLTLNANAGPHTWSGGSWGGDGKTVLAPNATLTIGNSYSYPGYSSQLNGRTLEVSGLALADIKGAVDVVGGSNLLDVKPGGELRFSAPTYVGGGGGFQQFSFSPNGIHASDGTLSIQNAGLMKVTGVSAGITSSAVGVNVISLTSPGEVRVGAGDWLSFGANYGATNVVAALNGVVTVEAGATLENVSALMNLTPTTLNAANGNLVHTGGTTGLDFSQLGTGGVLGSMAVYDGTVSLQGAASVNSLTQSGGSVSGTGSLNVSQAFSQAAGSISLGSLSATQLYGAMNIAGNITTTGNLTLSAPQGGLRIAPTAHLQATTNGDISLSGTGSTDEGGDEVGVWIYGGVTANAGTVTISGLGGASDGGYNDGVRMASGAWVESNSGSILIEGVRGDELGDYSRGVRLDADSAVQTIHGNITIRGNTAATGSGLPSNNASGVSIQGRIVSTGSGAISITGYGAGDPLGLFHRGVEVEGGAEIATGSGPITLRGYGGRGAGNAYGVDIDIEGGVSPYIHSATGRISIHGTRHASASGSENDGVRVDAGAVIETGAADAGTSPAILITGDGANGLATDANNGVRLAGTIRNTGTGSIVINGSGAGIGVSNRGIDFLDATLETLSGAIRLSGTGAGLGGNNEGVYLDDGLIQSVTGAIDIQGTGSLFGLGGHGVVLDDPVIRAKSSQITIVGTASSQSGNEGVYAYGTYFELGTQASAHISGTSFLNDYDFSVSGYTYQDAVGNSITETGAQVTLDFADVPARNVDYMYLNGGDLRLAPGTHLVNDGTNFGLILVEAGTLRVDPGASLQLEAGSFATVEANGILNSQGAVNLSGGSLALNGSANLSSLAFTSGTLNGTGSLSVVGNFSQGPGALVGEPFGNTLSDIDITQSSGSLAVGPMWATNSLRLSASSGAISVGGALKSGGTVRIGAFGGDLSIEPSASVEALGAGRATIFGTTGNFVNLAGPSALATPNGSWLVYSTHPELDTRGGLVPDFKQYATAMPSSPGYTGPGTGNGMVYSVAPVLTASLSGTSTKTYDGNASAPLQSTSYSVAGTLDNDSVQVAGLTGSFVDKNVGSPKLVTVDLNIVSASNSSGAIPVYGYQLDSPTVSASIGNITPRPLNVSATGNNKVYDGGVVASVGLSDNRVSGDTLTLSNSTATFGDKNVATGKSISVAGISVSGTDALNYTLANTSATTSADITARTLNVSATGNNKVYDGGVVASVGLSDNRVSGDTLTLSNSTATFGDKNVGTGKSISVAGISVSGTDALNYTLANTSATTSADITARTLNVSATGSNKVYDGGVVASVGLSDNRVSGDTLTLSNSAATFGDKNVGTGKSISVAGISVSGADVGNYTLANTSATTIADITARTLNVSATGSNKVYDGGVVASVGLSDNRVSGDTLTLSNSTATFGDKNVGTGKSISVAGISVSGTDALNYTLANTSATTSADITARTLNVSATGSNKVYDGGVVASVGLSDNRVSGDTLTLSNSTATFGDKNVGTGKSISVAGISVSGADVGNYTLANTSATTSADITARTLNVSATGSNKVYDGGVVASVGLSDNRVSGDTLTLSNSAATFGDKNVGTGKSISVAGISVSGADVGNYTLANTSATTSADITIRPLATWTAGAVSGQWSNAANWDALPDGSNVATVAIPAGATVTFDAAVGNTQVQTISSTGALNLSGGSLAVASGLTTAQFSQSAGTLSGTGSLMASNSFNQTGGAIAMGGPVSATQAVGNLQVGSVTASAINLTATTGSISQVGGLVTSGLLETRSAGATLMNHPDNRINSFRATVTTNGNIELTNLGVIDVRGMDSQVGSLVLSNIGGISTSGAVIARSGDVTMTANSPLTIGAAGIQASGNISLTATNLTSAGNMAILGNLTSTGGSINLNAANNFVQNSAVTAALGVSASAGSSMTFGSLATTVGSPVSYTVNGVLVTPPPQSLATGASNQSNLVSEFLQQFEEVLVSQDLQLEPGSEDKDKKKEKEKTNGSVVVEAPTCPR